MNQEAPQTTQIVLKKTESIVQQVSPHTRKLRTIKNNIKEFMTLNNWKKAEHDR